MVLEEHRPEEDGVGCWWLEGGGGGGVGPEEHKPGVDGGSKKEETRKCRVEDPAVLLPLLGFTLICSGAYSIFFCYCKLIE